MIFVAVVLVSQCKKYRDQFTDQQKLIYEEKLEASELFKDKKALYPSRYYDFCSAHKSQCFVLFSLSLNTAKFSLAESAFSQG